MFLRNKTLTPVQQADMILADAVSNATDMIASAKQRVAYLRSDKRKVRREIARIISIAGVDAISRVFIAPRYYKGDTVTVIVGTHDQDSLRSPMVERVLTYFIENGWDARGSTDTAASGTREHVFAKDNIRVTFEVQIADDSAKCRKVLVGQETIVRDKYEFECND